VLEDCYTYNQDQVDYMVLNNYRHLLPRFINGPVNFCVKHKITANAISYMGFFVSLFTAACFALPKIFLYSYSKISTNFWWWWATIPIFFFFLSGYIDVIDGAVARKMKISSNFGAFLDSTLDRLSDAILILGLILGGVLWPGSTNFVSNSIMGFVALIIILMISYTRSRAELEGVVMKGIGFMERAERWFLILFILIAEWITFAVQVQFMDIDPLEVFHLLPYLFIVFILLCAQTLWSRINWAYKWLGNKMPEKVAKILARKEAENLDQKTDVFPNVK